MSMRLTNLTYLVLGSKRRTRCRYLARQSFIACNGDKDAAIELTKKRINAEFKSIIASFFIALMIRLAIELIVYWVKQRLSVPPEQYQQNEPGFGG